MTKRWFVYANSVVSDSFWPHRLQPTRTLSSRNFPGKATGVHCHFLLWRVFLTQGSNLWLLCLLHWQADSLLLIHLGFQEIISLSCFLSIDLYVWFIVFFMFSVFIDYIFSRILLSYMQIKCLFCHEIDFSRTCHPTWSRNLLFVLFEKGHTFNVTFGWALGFWQTPSSGTFYSLITVGSISAFKGSDLSLW